ncbi:response regulator [Pseudomonas sp. RP23018S]|uniref:response regulator n=1 Tax=Pseudomonas sp. RP23018S TaxID=3096037 RepID=UPI002ACADE52|nr:response regulator [Pseudomonas sp. RP23018S]MDZ5604553.1 response regulator [Pseudomonas sp. RP23018S]
MKFSHLLPAAHSKLSSPLTASALLRLFAFTLVAGVCIGAYSYVRVSLDQEISARRSAMNEAVFDAQGFFISRQTLLKSLGLSTVRHPIAAQAYANSVPEEEVHIILSDAEDTWSLWLTRRLLDYVRANQVNLVYIPHNPLGQVQRLFTSAHAPASIPAGVLQRVRETDAQRDELWLTAPGRLDSPLYLFTRLDERDVSSGWLGLEVDGPDLIKALQHEQAGDFTLLDGSGQPIVSNTAQFMETSGPLAGVSATPSFGWEGGHWLPERLTIRKHLDYADWQIVYSLQMTALLPVLAVPMGLALLACLLATLLTCWLVCRIEQRLIAPAAARIEALVESEAFCSAVIRIAPVALCVLRRNDGMVVLENPLCSQWLGQDGARTHLGPGWVERGVDRGCGKSGTEELQTVDGRHLHLSYAATRYQGEEVLICAFNDITERKSSELALQQARTLADAANEAKTLFLATMSHEIRTPLYGILATLELLARTQLDGQQQGYLSAIEGSSSTLLQLICDVLDVAKIEAGQLALELSAFSPLAMTEEVIQGYTGAAHNKGLQLYACIDPQLPEQVVGDAIRTRQILANLLSNAVKFTDSGRIVVRVQWIEQEGACAMLRWQVVDTGKGIALEDQRYVFEPFFQSSPNANVVAGTGLGLSICRRLVDVMEGTLRVFSEPGLGSSFAFSLPLEPIVAPERSRSERCLSGEWVYVHGAIHELAECAVGWLRRWGARAQLGVPDPAQVPGDAVLVEVCPGRASTALWPDWPGKRVLVCADAHGVVRVGEGCWHVGLNDLRSLNLAVSRAPLITRSVQPREKIELRLHILVAEDSVINQLILRDQLEELGCSTVLVRDGIEALARWQEQPFDVVITDVNMPRMNGYELTERLRRLECRIPIVGATANAMLNEAERCLSVGMDQFLVKPFTLQALHQCLLPYQRSEP